jgi:hypothetical protein
LIINALVAFRGRPLFLFSPKGTLKKIKELCRTLRKGSVEFFILFLRLWTHLETFGNLQNLFEGFSKAPLFFQSTSFAAGGGLQNFNRIAVPTKYLQTYSFKKFGQLQNPFFHLDSVLDKVNLHITN